MKKWDTYTLGDICKTNSSLYSSKNNWSFVNYLDTGNITENKINTVQYINLNKEKLPSRAKRKVKYNSIIYSTVRPNQKHFGIIKEQPENFLVSTGFVVIDVDEDKADADFIFYYLSRQEITDYLHAVGEQSTSAYPSIRPSDIENIEITLPDIEEQRRISSILKLLSNKMAINDEINRNLQDQALALYKSYFMDYEPYGGVQPCDWETVSLDDVCEKITDGSHYSPQDNPEAPFPMYSVKDMETYGFNPSSCKHIGEEELEKMKKNDCVPKKKDILVAKDGSYLKEIFICSEDRNEAILSSIAIFRPDLTKIIPELLLYMFKQPAVKKDVGDNYVSGSALPRIVLKDFKKYSFVLPPIEEQRMIGDVLESLQAQIKLNVDENQRLTILRDSLLPKLMSGELDVSKLDI